MTRDETVKIIRILVATYPNFKPDNLSDTVDVWCVMLEEFPYEVVSVALKACVTSIKSSFPPSVSEIIDMIHTVSQPEELSEMEAWALVSRALKNGYYGAEAEFDKLPPIVQKVVASPSQLRNWAVTDSESIENVVQSNFMRTFRIVQAREKEIAKMPTDARRMIEKVNENRIQISPPRNNNIIEDKQEKEIDSVPMPEDARKRIQEMFEKM